MDLYDIYPHWIFPCDDVRLDPFIYGVRYPILFGRNQQSSVSRSRTVERRDLIELGRAENELQSSPSSIANSNHPLKKARTNKSDEMSELNQSVQQVLDLIKVAL
ncbi:hypothetical protein PsorP6_008955 [Peronosclerospora sorghi]|uniref:Uncharacterized protein n=1 Tax=Peronosclerospora sorghi TaxID=230839 RepID=A0ACC0W1A3_9STRA|nr:hypothetical protein PsorP6_008955 [Peronosclerospora sorghi]